MDFPSVTICNYNMITAYYLASKNDSMLDEAVAYLSTITNPFVAIPDLSEELADYMKTVDAEEFYSQGAHQMDVYFSCFYPNKLAFDCNFTDGLMVTRGTDMGVCHTFHPQSYIEAAGKALETGSAGKTGGFQVMIDIEQDLYTLGASSAGVKVLVHDPKTLPNVFELGVALQPGTEANLAVRKMELISLPEPYADEGDDCLDTGDPNPLKYHDYYSWEACKVDRMIDLMLENCKCVHYFYKVPNMPICNLYDSYFCALGTLIEYSVQEMSAGCPKTCDEIMYEVSVSQSHFPNKRILEDLTAQLNIDEAYVTENLISMNVYFGELAVQITKQEKGYTLQSAIAEIGGYLGLCLGASILTLCEFLQLFWDYCERCANTERRPKNSVTDMNLGHASINQAT